MGQRETKTISLNITISILIIAHPANRRFAHCDIDAETIYHVALIYIYILRYASEDIDLSNGVIWISIVLVLSGF